MTFLNPLVLFGLAAAAIPVILHLLNLRKLKTIEFSTLTFLKELQQTKIRRLKVRQLLLLLIRTLIVILIVLAFARPALRGRILGTIGSHAHSSVVFILDDSFSLTVSDEQGSRLKQLKEAALRFVDLLKDGDEVFLVKLSDLPRATVEPAMHDFEPVRTIIREMQLSMVRRTMEDALKVSARLLTQSTNANKEVYILTDLQRTLFTRELREKEQAQTLFDEQVKFFVVPVSEKLVPNTSIDSVDVVSKILEKNKPVKLYTSLRNFNTIPLRNEVVSVFLDKVRAAQTNVSVDAMGTASAEFTFTPKKSGDLNGYVEIENDAIEYDNRRYFHINIPSRLNITVVSGQNRPADFIITALRSSTGAGEESLIHIDEIAEAKLPLLDFKNVDVLICADVRSISRSDALRIKDFLTRGGGVVLYPGDDLDLQNYNTELVRLLEIPPFETITRIPAGQAPLSFKGIDLDHPLFETMFETEARGRKSKPGTIESPAITSALRRQTGRQGRTLIGLSDGGTFLSEYRIGQGNLLVYSVAPNPAWSDFPIKGIFAPLTYRSVMYAGIGEEAGTGYLTGDAPGITLKRTQAGSAQFKLVSPDSVEDLLQATAPSGKDDHGGGRTFTVKPFLIPGVYQLKAEKTSLMSLVVNVDKLESDTRIATGEELSGFWARMGIPESSIQSLEEQSAVQDAVLRSRFGVELWRYCAFFALMLALLEMMIARDSRSALQGQTA